MAKAPRPGTVKTRLMDSLPSSAVTALYGCLLEDTLALARSLTDVEVSVMCPERDRDELMDLLGDTVEVIAQQGSGLPAGLTSAFRHFTADGRHVIAFNSDSPHLAPQVLQSAFETLARHDDGDARRIRDDRLCGDPSSTSGRLPRVCPCAECFWWNPVSWIGVHGGSHRGEGQP